MSTYKKKPSNPLKEQIRKEIDLSNGKEQFIRCRNWQIQQCSFLIGLLNTIGDLMIVRPTKMKTKSLPFYRVQSITINDQTFDVSQMVEERINKLVEKDMSKNVSSTTINRRKDVYKVMEHLHVLMDVLVNESGYKIETTNDKHCSLFDKRILHSVDYGLDVFKNKLQIKRIGEKMNAFLTQMFTNETIKNKSDLKYGDTEIMAILLSE